MPLNIWEGMFYITLRKNWCAKKSLAILESDSVADQPLVNLLNRGGLTGINVQTRIMFTKAEKVFRDFVAKNNPQNIDCRKMIDTFNDGCGNR